MTGHVLAIDQGTTSTRAIVFRADCTIAAIARQKFLQHFPQSGWVEHDPEDLWRTTLATCRETVATAGLAARDIAAIGIANQRETTLVWDRATGKPIHNAMMWQDRCTAGMCRQLIDRAAKIAGRTRSEFMLEAARRAAQKMLLDTILFVLDATAFNRFKALLDAPPKANPRLGELMRKRAPWDHDARRL